MLNPNRGKRKQLGVAPGAAPQVGQEGAKSVKDGLITICKGRLDNKHRTEALP